MLRDVLRLQHRLRKELRNILREPPPHITARPLSDNILKWYFVLEGPQNTPYEGGIYLGRLHFTDQYPYKPPGKSCIDVFSGSNCVDDAPMTKMCVVAINIHIIPF